MITVIQTYRELLRTTVYTQFELSNNPFVWYIAEEKKAKPAEERIVKMEYEKNKKEPAEEKSALFRKELCKDYNYRYIQLVKNLRKMKK